MNSDKDKDKIDIIDFIINVLREHERTLDELIERLKNIVERGPSPLTPPYEKNQPLVTVTIEEWEDFKTKSTGASVAAFQTSESQLLITAAKEGTLYVYTEHLPDVRIKAKKTEDRYMIEETSLTNPEDFSQYTAPKLKCGLPTLAEPQTIKLEEKLYLITISRKVETQQAKAWLSNELKVQEKDIVRGEISLRS